jgi:hypothetical protein
LGSGARHFHPGEATHTERLLERLAAWWSRRGLVIPSSAADHRRRRCAIIGRVEAGTTAQARGPVGETRSIGLSILWFILTLGIYSFYWVYKTHEEIKRYSGNGIGGVLGLVIWILISPVTFFVVPSEVRWMYEDLDGETSPVRGIYGLWILLPIAGSIIWFVQVQGALNRYWESKGASPA